ncbi:ML domain-containing protein [Streptomyces sp. NPDC051657]|uniref:ML domain-containing protein n=1 Tax=unclassified Streptomyces TaxID=2593676 RepID=UPI003426DE84
MALGFTRMGRDAHAGEAMIDHQLPEMERYMTTSMSDLTWSSGGSANDSFTIGSVACDPHPPVRGNDLTVTLTGTLAEPITGGSAKALLKYGIVTVVKDSTPLQAAEAGPYTARQVISIPEGAPSGAYTLNVVLSDAGGTEIGSVGIELRLS